MSVNRDDVAECLLACRRALAEIALIEHRLYNIVTARQEARAWNDLPSDVEPK